MGSYTPTRARFSVPKDLYCPRRGPSLGLLHTNEVADPFAALTIYNLRNKVEFDFNQFKNWVEGDRVRCSDSGYLGKMFVCTLATCIRLMMMRKAQSNETKDLKIPGDSMDQLFRHLKHIRADRRPKAAAWVMR